MVETLTEPLLHLYPEPLTTDYSGHLSAIQHDEMGTSHLSKENSSPADAVLRNIATGGRHWTLRRKKANDKAERQRADAKKAEAERQRASLAEAELQALQEQLNRP